MSSYAIISLGGKQYRVQEGERLLVDRLRADEGKTFEPRVLLVGGDGATDLSPSTTVTARVVGHELGEKIRIGKYRSAPATRSTPATAAADADRDRVDRRRQARSEGRREAEGREGGAEGGDSRPSRRRSSSRPRQLPEGYAVDDDRADHRGSGRLEPREVEAALEHERSGKARKGAIAALESALRGEELMAHKKGLGSSRNGRDSNPQMLGVKLFAGQDVTSGMILVRQRGTRFRPGPGTGIGKDDTIFAMRDGKVAFRTSGERRFISVEQALGAEQLASTRASAVRTTISRGDPRETSPSPAPAAKLVGGSSRDVLGASS